MLAPPLEPLSASSRRFHKTTIEEVEDEGDAIQTKKKKKKKKKKTSKKPQETPASSQPPPVLQSVPTSPSPSTSFKSAEGSPAKQPSSKSSIKNSMGAVDANFSRSSLPLPRETTAQSARAYIQSENLTTEKTKVKTRPAFAGSFLKSHKEPKEPRESGTENRGLLNRMKPKIKNVPKRISDSLIQLIGSRGDKKKPMKWEKFLKVGLPVTSPDILVE